MQPDETSQGPVNSFKAYAPGLVHIDIKYLPQMPDENQRRYVFVAIDRATRWVYVEIRASKSATAPEAFIKALHATAPFKVEQVLNDNDKALTDRSSRAGERTPSGEDRFDQCCVELAIEHRLIKPRWPQTNDMAERFNGRTADVLRTNRFDSSASLQTTVKRFVYLYSRHAPHKLLHHKTPAQTLQ